MEVIHVQLILKRMVFSRHKNTKSLLASIISFCPLACTYHKPLYAYLQTECMYAVCSAFPCI